MAIQRLSGGIPVEGSTRADVNELMSRLDPLPSERAVLSTLLVRIGGRLVVTHASLLIGPAAMSRLSWDDWVRHEGGRDLGLLPVGMPAAFAINRKTFTLARASLTIRQAQSWLESALSGQAPPIRPVPEAATRFGSTRAPALARPGNSTPASGFVCRSERPVRGFLFPVDAPLTVVSADLKEKGQLLQPRSVVGIDVPTAGPRVGTPTEPGIFFGRLQRRAWMPDVTYEAENELLNIRLRLDQADPYELELEIREYVGDDLADSRRLRLADIPLPARAHRRFGLRVPTLGRGIQRTVSLYGRGGELLDELVRFNILERIHLSFGVEGAREHTTTIGDKRPAPTAFERLSDLKRVEESYEWWLAKGAKRRIISGIDATSLLRRRLRRANGELLILDPYFGKEPGDWDLLKSVKVPVRILTGRDAKSPPTRLPNVTARKWIQIPIPFHDRFYVWASAGLNVGTSPSGLKGFRAFRIDELSMAEVKAVQQAFAKWWVSPRTKAL